jgi:hypothetical protein
MRKRKHAANNFFAALNASSLSGEVPGDEIAPLQIIRTETVVSRLPVHNLAKTGEIKISIVRQGKNGKNDLVWEVRHSSGQPRQLAYKVDTLVINRRIDEAGKNLPKCLRLGSLSEICADLGITASGKTRESIKQALIQNAGTFIKAKVSYTGADGREYELTSYFNRYNVHFAGQRFPTGERADAVYISFSDEYYNVLLRAKRRPLDFNYLKDLTPAAQRFYEIVSYQMFAALMNNAPRAQLLYSEYVTFSAQQRYEEYAPFAKQMYKVHLPHISSGYIEDVSYFKTTDAQGRPDWIMSYKPGPKARAEFLNFNKGRAAGFHQRSIEGEIGEVIAGHPHLAESAKTAEGDEKNPLSQAELLVSQFLQQRFGSVSRQAQPAELRHARNLIEVYGWDVASYVVTYSVEKARKENYLVRYLNGVAGYLNEALDSYHQRQAVKSRPQVSDQPASEAYILEGAAYAKAEQLLAALSPDDYAKQAAAVRERIRNTGHPSLASWSQETWDSTIRAAILRQFTELEFAQL